MKKDAREFAHLIKAFKGGAEYMWCNFDQVHLIAIYAECAAIEDELQKDINASNNKVGSGRGNTNHNGAKVSFNDGGGFSFSNLEDVPATPEDEIRFAKMVEEAQRKAALRKSKKAKIT